MVILCYYVDMSFKEIVKLIWVSINIVLGCMCYVLINICKLVEECEIVL